MLLSNGSLVLAGPNDPEGGVLGGTFCWPLPNCPEPNSPMYDRTGVVSISAGFHTGWDFPVGQGVDIYAIGAGTVVSAGYDSGNGNNIIIKHTLKEPWVLDLGNGETINYGTTLYSRYCHMNEPALVAAGATVAGGQIIGHVGTTGNSTGFHLHMAIMSQNPGVAKQIAQTEGFLSYSTTHGKPVYGVLATIGNHQRANFAPNMVCGVLEYIGETDEEHEVDTEPDYWRGESFGPGGTGSPGEESPTDRSYGYIGGVVVRGGKLVSQLLDPGTGIVDREDNDVALNYTGVMTDYGTLATFNTLAAKMKDVIQKYSRIGAALLLFIGTVAVGFGIILQNRNPEQRTFLITGLFAVGIGALIVTLAVYVVNMVVKYM